MAVRAAVAAGLSLGLASVFDFERAYWAILVSVAVVEETWGQSVQRAVDRLLMTALGGLAGWALHMMLGHSTSSRAFMLFTCVFFAVYYRGRSYRRMIFFVTVYVVFLLAVVGVFRPGLILVRVYETAIGCATALGAAVLVRAPRASDNLSHAFRDLWDKCEQEVKWAFDRALSVAQSHGTEEEIGPRLELYYALLRLHEQRGISMYESITPARTFRHWNSLLQTTRELCHSVISLQEGLEAQCGTKPAGVLRDQLAAYQQAALRGFGPLRGEASSFLEMPHETDPMSPLAIIEDSVRAIARLCRRLQRERKGMA